MNNLKIGTTTRLEVLKLIFQKNSKMGEIIEDNRKDNFISVVTYFERGNTIDTYYFDKNNILVEIKNKGVCSTEDVERIHKFIVIDEHGKTITY